jgi:alkylated DNA repair dioxygenase AlkB
MTKEKITISLAAGSLLIMKGGTQDYWRHCLPKMTKAISSRINITFRKIHL